MREKAERDVYMVNVNQLSGTVFVKAIDFFGSRKDSKKTGAETGSRSSRRRSKTRARRPATFPARVPTAGRLDDGHSNQPRCV